jgi:hypothetical protein
MIKERQSNEKKNEGVLSQISVASQERKGKGKGKEKEGKERGRAV